MDSSTTEMLALERLKSKLASLKSKNTELQQLIRAEARKSVERQLHGALDAEAENAGENLPKG